MNILMMTNTYLPVVGGIEQSIRSFSWQFRAMGHNVLVVAPTPAGPADRNEKVIRIPAIEHNREPKFSINLPVPGLLPTIMRRFKPDIVHSHYPFFMGDYALRLSRQYHVPLVFTYHIMFEHYTHYLPLPKEAARRFTTTLAAGYANWAQQVIAPSQSVADILRRRGVIAPIAVVPTGVDTKAFAKGNGELFRQKHQIPQNVFVVGHLGRLAPEKNLNFLVPSILEFLKRNSKAHALIVGEGIWVPMIQRKFEQAGLAGRLHMTGFLHGQELVDAYHAMDVFSFASLSETQGVVVTEAMACGVPVVAVDAPGVREVVQDGHNGRLIKGLDRARFVRALNWTARQASQRRRQLKQHAKCTAGQFSLAKCAGEMLAIYEQLARQGSHSAHDESSWHAFRDRFKAEWGILKNVAHAAEAAVGG